MTAFRSGIAIAALLLSACANQSPPIASATDTELVIKSLRERFELPSDITTLRIENDFGEVNIRSMEPGAIGVVATSQESARPGNQPRLEFSVDGSLARLVVSYAENAVPLALLDGKPGRLDLAVFIPPLKRLELQTAADRIQVKRYAGDVHARSRSGDLLISGAGLLDLKTDSGLIQAMQISGKWEGESQALSGSGVVEVAIPRDADVAISASAQSLLEVQLGDRWQSTSRTELQTSGHLGQGIYPMRIAGREVYLRGLVTN